WLSGTPCAFQGRRPHHRFLTRRRRRHRNGQHKRQAARHPLHPHGRINPRHKHHVGPARRRNGVKISIELTCRGGRLWPPLTRESTKPKRARLAIDETEAREARHRRKRNRPRPTSTTSIGSLPRQSGAARDGRPYMSFTG